MRDCALEVDSFVPGICHGAVFALFGEVQRHAVPYFFGGFSFPVRCGPATDVAELLSSNIS